MISIRKYIKETLKYRQLRVAQIKLINELAKDLPKKYISADWVKKWVLKI